MLGYFKVYIWLIVVLVIAITSNSFAKSIEEQFKDAESLIEIDQTKEALQLLKGIEPENNIQIAEQLYLLGRLYFALGKFGKADEFYMDANLQNPTEPQYQVGLSQTSFALGKLKLAAPTVAVAPAVSGGRRDSAVWQQLSSRRCRSLSIVAFILRKLGAIAF